MHATSLPQLHVFLAVARHRSFASAARELGVSSSAVSQAVKQLEEQLRVVLLTRTTRSVSPTEAGARLVENAGPALQHALEALSQVSAKPGEVVGRLKLSVSRMAVRLLVTPVLPTFRARHPRIDVEVVVEDRLVDIVGEGYDAGVRLEESIDRDMVQVRLTERFRFVIVGTPGTSRATAHRECRRTCCITNASGTERSRWARSTRGNWSAGVGPGAFRCAAGWSRTIRSSASSSRSKDSASSTPSSHG
jgi:DNA-binding transcriptional LysR family regulator